MQFEFHPLANLFPLIEGEDFAALVADIKSNGLHEPIDVYQGKILDGRNRYRAVCAAGLELEKRFFRTFHAEFYGDPVAYVISKNLNRRHLDDVQRASVAAKIANLSRGGDRSKPPIGGLTAEQVAEKLNVAPRQVERARVVHDQGVPELREALDRGEVAVSKAEQIARMPEGEQREAVKTINGARAIAARRFEPDASLDFFPTPPWATRALIEHAFGCLPEGTMRSIWEPACGEGHMAEVLREYCPNVLATDVFDYGYSDQPPCDFLSDEAADYENREWIITNPPFDDKALRFVTTALERAIVGVAMFFRSQWAVEGIERYETIFRRKPPTLCAFFVERVNLCKGCWNPDGDTLTAYCWLIWQRDACARPPMWIPPGCRKSLERPGDRERFTAHPVIRREPEPVKPIERPVAKPPLPEIEIPPLLRVAP